LVAKEDLDIDLQDNNGWTALHFAVYLHREKMIDELLTKGACVLLNDEFGDTPIQLTQDKTLLSKLNLRANSNIVLPPKPQKTTVSTDNTKAKGEISTSIPSLPSKHSDSESIIVNLPTESSTVTNNNVAEFFHPSDSEQGPKTNMALTLLINFWFLVWTIISNIWTKYRYALYLGTLAALGVLFVMEYLPLSKSSYALNQESLDKTQKTITAPSPIDSLENTKGTNWGLNLYHLVMYVVSTCFVLLIVWHVRKRLKFSGVVTLLCVTGISFGIFFVIHKLFQ